jgi:HlyD family secretion protein
VIPPGPAKAERRDIVAYETFGGELYVPPASRAVVHPTYNAPLEQVYVTVGKRVGKGAVLMKLSIPEAEANYSEATSTVRQAETAYANARNTYNDALQEARRQLDAARKAERDARANSTPGGDATALLEAQAARQQAEAAVQQAEADYKASIQGYKDQLGAARSSRRSAKADARQTEIKAPISGTIVSVNATPGQVVGESADEVLAEIVDLKEIKVRAGLTAEQFGRLKEKSPVVIRFADFPDKPFDGWVVSLRTLPQAVGGVDHETLIGFRNDDGLVKPGAVVDSVGIEVARADDVVTVPVGAVDKDTQDRPVVQVLEGENWVPHVVETGASDGTYVEIKSGVKEGDTVRVTAETTLKT